MICFITSRSASPLERDQRRAHPNQQPPLGVTILGDESPIHFVPTTEKANPAMTLRATLMREDHPATALALAQDGIHVMLPRFGYNRRVSPLIHPVAGWREPSLMDLLAV